jgi:hypothetical protein
MASGVSPGGAGCGVAPKFDDKKHVIIASGGAGSWGCRQTDDYIAALEM